jgi:YtoQ family protein
MNDPTTTMARPHTESTNGAVPTRAPDRTWRVYLAGEIHGKWRDEIADGVRERELPIVLSAPVARHSLSDDIGVKILGREEEDFWRDQKGSGINAIRTRVHLADADVVVASFDDIHKELNVAFEAGHAAALGKPIIALHPPELDHALKELDRAALAVARTTEQVVRILRYVIVA